MRKVFFSVITCAIACLTYSQEIVSFSSLNNIGCSGVISNNVNLTANGICRGSGIDEKNGASTYNSINWSIVFDNNDYLEWTISPNLGYEINLSSMDIAYDRSNNGPKSIDIQIDYGLGFNSIYIDNTVDTTVKDITIDLSSFTNINSILTFRLYGYNAVNGTGTFDIEEYSVVNKGIIINGTVSPYCSSTVTWNGTSWNPSSPTINTNVLLNGDYNTSTNGSFSACSLTINSGTLIIDNNDFVEVQKSLVANGNIIIRPQGAFVQIEDSATVTASGNITVEKTTAPANNWYEYTYWSSPVNGATIANGLSDAQSGRIFSFNAQNYLDATMEVNNDNTTSSGQDDVDDDNNAWQSVSAVTVMMPGYGYASTHDRIIFESSPGNQFTYTFEGAFNNGIINVPMYRNDSETNDKNWNFIGNPYPSAINADAFFITNPDTDGIIYLWSQNTPPSSSTNGNAVLNFSDSDYARINSTGEVAGGDGITPSRFIPSGQGFFVTYSDAATPITTSGNISEGSITFNNAMRVRGTSNNSQFFKTSNSKIKTASNFENKLWIDLTSNNGVFNQVLIGYVEGATNKFDGPRFDAAKTTSLERYASLYSTIKGSDKKLVIQGKNPYDLTLNEKIGLGFSTTIHIPTQFKLSIKKLQGEFLSNNTIYLKDKLLNKHHDLSSSDYSFTSEIGEFNNRFEITFKANASYNNSVAQKAGVKIFELNNGNINFSSINDLSIKSVQVFDFLSSPLYNLKGSFDSKAFNLSKLKKAVYIAKIEFSNGTIVTKKFIIK
ncbi:T9SS type A sorting domain-containing protein [Seonamhaeicola maritimus]|uniref:T9SS type A sorting domain-containing protein n=1 Tax=Seonamhaeicola maritimus TaxID=2591822 RepID=UPI002495A17E|nr:T9SS type A sorting domain-containing protein [Seonamhaeicola maritimus]